MIQIVRVTLTVPTLPQKQVTGDTFPLFRDNIPMSPLLLSLQIPLPSSKLSQHCTAHRCNRTNVPNEAINTVFTSCLVWPTTSRSLAVFLYKLHKYPFYHHMTLKIHKFRTQFKKGPHWAFWVPPIMFFNRGNVAANASEVTIYGVKKSQLLRGSNRSF